MNIVANTFHDDSAIAYTQNYKCNFNSINKIVELYNEKQELYERMIQEKNNLIDKLLNK